MKTMKGTFLAVLALALLSTAGCDRHSNKEVFYLISANLNLPYWQNAAAGFNRAAAEYKVTARVEGPPNYDPQAELDAMHKAVAAKPAGILISVADSAVLKPEIDAAIAAGVPVITIDSDAQGSKRLFFIGTNNLEAGRMGGRHAAQKLNGKGNVVFFTFAGQPNTEERLKGFKDVFAGHPDIKIVDTIDVSADARNAFDKTQQMMAFTGPKKIDALHQPRFRLRQAGLRCRQAYRLSRTASSWPGTLTRMCSMPSRPATSTPPSPRSPSPWAMSASRPSTNSSTRPSSSSARTYAADPFSPLPVFVDTGTDLVDKTNVDAYIARGPPTEPSRLKPRGGRDPAASTPKPHVSSRRRGLFSCLPSCRMTSNTAML